MTRQSIKIEIVLNDEELEKAEKSLGKVSYRGEVLMQKYAYYLVKTDKKLIMVPAYAPYTA